MKKKLLSFLLASAMLLTTQGIPTLAGSVTGGNEPESTGAATPANPVHDCTKENGGTDTTTWSYVYFGSYPQTEVTGDDLTTAITGASYDANGDAWVNGTKYRRASKSDANNTGYFGNSTYRYFKWERIKWRVLENNGSTLFVVADQGLDCKDYNETYTSITWGNCTLRTWLNGTFYNTAFSSSEQGAIVQQTVVNDDNPDYGTSGGNNTQDNVYLLSIAEVKNPEYGFCEDYSVYSASRWMQPSDYAHAMGASTYSSSSTGGNANCWWWLRSPGNYTDYAAFVSIYGYVDRFGLYVYSYSEAVAPALQINLSSDLWTTADDGTSGEGGGSGTGDGSEGTEEGGNGTGSGDDGSGEGTEQKEAVTINGYTIYVTDTSGNPIYNARVVIGVDSTSTDTNGKAEFSTIKAWKDEKDAVTFNIRVSAGGYSAYTGYDYAVSDSHTTYITMLTVSEADDDGVSLVKNDCFESVLYKDAVFGNIDLMVNQKTISLSEPYKQFDLTVKVKEDMKAYVKRYYILSGSRRVAESETGEFKDLYNREFEADKKVYIMLDVDQGSGEVKRAATQRQQINLSVKNPGESVKNAYGSISLGEKLSFTAPGNTPFIGGSKFDLAKLNLPVDLKLSEDGSFILSVNTDDAELIDKNGVLFKNSDTEKAKQDVKEKDVLDNTLFGMYKSAIEKSSENLASGKEENSFYKTDIKFCDSLKFTSTIGGYISGKLNDSVKKGTGNLYISIKTSYKAEATFVFTVPITASIEVGASGKASATIQVDFTDASKSIGESVNGNLQITVSPYLKLAAGPGCKEVNVKLTGGFSLPVDYFLLGENTGLQSILLEANAGVSGKLFCLEKEWEIISGTLPIYTRAEAADALGIEDTASGEDITVSPYDISDLKPADYSALADRGWNEVSVTEEGSIILNPAVSNYAETKTVSAGDTALMVYRDADPARDAYNADILYYSIYDTSSGIWGEPKPVDANGTADFDFDLYSDGEKIYLAYQEMGRELNAGDSLSDMAFATRIVFARFDAENGVFTDFETLADDADTYVMRPTLVKNGSVLTAAWVENSAPDYYALNNTNAIAAKSYENGTWSDASTLLQQAGRICEVEGCVLDGETYLAYIEDTDANLDTTKDRNVSLLDLAGQKAWAKEDDALNANLIYSSAGDTPALYWYWENTIVALDSAEGQPKELLDGLEILPNEDFTIVSDGDAQAILFTQSDLEQESDTAEAYLMYCLPDGTYSQPVRVTEDNAYISGFSGTIADGEALLNYRQDEYVYGEDSIEISSSLHTTLIRDFSRIAMENLDYDYDAMDPGESLTVTADVTNAGSHPVTALDLTLLSPSGEKLEEKEISAILGIGETKNLSVDINVPETLEAGNYVLTLSESGMEGSGASAEFGLLYSDISVMAEVITLGENTYISAVLDNHGDLPAEAEVFVTNNDWPDRVLSSCAVEEIAGGAYQSALIPVTEEMLTPGSIYTDFTVSAVSKEKDAYQYNNNALVQVESRVKSMTLDLDQMSLKQGETRKLSVSMDAMGTPEFEYTWSSSDSSIVKVDQTGLVTAVTPGETVVLVMTKQGDFAECTVTVTGNGTDKTEGGTSLGNGTVPAGGSNSSLNAKTTNITPKKTAISKLKAKSKAITVKWKKAASVTGYQIQYSTSKKFTKKTTKIKTVKTASKTKLTVKKLKAAKKYYVRIRTYKAAGGKKYYSGWSKAKSVKTKK